MHLLIMKLEGQEIPVYSPPKGIGILESKRGSNNWNSCL